MQCKMCSEHNKLTIVHLIRIWRTFRSTQQPLLYNEVGKDYLSSHISSEGLDALSCLKDSQLKIGSYVSVRSSRYEARGKFGEHERCVRVARGVAESNSSFLSGKCIFPRDLFADVMSVHNRNMKFVRAIEFDQTNLLAML